MFQPLPFVTRLTFKASDRPEAQEARERLAVRYGDAGEENAQVIVALGGDGFMRWSGAAASGSRAAAPTP